MTEKQGNTTRENSDLIEVQLELYRQAHETRRKWEGYIWQWGLLLTIMAAILVSGTIDLDTLSIIQKLILIVFTGFVISIYLNVLRARVLMKKLESAIIEFHDKMKMDFPIVPAELDKGLPFYNKWSSTRFAVFCHFLAAIAFTMITIYVWI